MPVLECWTTLTAVAARTSRLRVGSFVTNVMNRHPAVLARMLATISDQSGARVDLGMRRRRQPDEMAAYGIRFPAPPERTARRGEAVAVMRRCGRAARRLRGRFFQLRGAYAEPAPKPAPRIIVGGEKARRCPPGRPRGDGWTTNAPDYDDLLPIHLPS
jgi:alkanesulfonate monooxygenase SsuD/methylene tetrahydromethanopterin reductase-like flavin-dependent oxidoreductase (luciferase family)